MAKTTLNPDDLIKLIELDKRVKILKGQGGASGSLDIVKEMHSVMNSIISSDRIN